ncbi:3-methyl-2-oxobutanoate hydroxymethyltransferase [Mortierella sp. GBAus27b]|nr:3-methyl-2-oxobutanoate hydroxymethyltransferase [Mortierella sp. GBAus27b]
MSVSARFATQVRSQLQRRVPRSASTHLATCSMLRTPLRQQIPSAAVWMPVNHAMQPAVHMRSYSTRPAETDHHHVRPKVTLATLRKLYKRGEPITVMTAHDFPSGTLVDKAGIDMTLVGDSLAMVALGYTSTSDITIDEMLHHCRAVARGTRSSFLVADMPFGTYETSPDQAVNNAVRMMKEGKVEAVKLEGGKEMAPTISRLTQVGIPVLGHIGLTPQRQASLGGYKVQGKTAAKAKGMIDDALALQQAGCYAIVLEAVPEPVARHITSLLLIPTIGIGAGAGCSGQVLVQQDMLGLYGRVPRFCKTYRSLADEIVGAMREYSADVKSGVFPAAEHCYPMPAEELERFMHSIGEKSQVKKDVPTAAGHA